MAGGLRLSVFPRREWALRVVLRCSGAAPLTRSFIARWCLGRGDRRSSRSTATFLHVAVWKADNEDPGFNLVENGFVSKFRSRNVLDDEIGTLRATGYRIVRMDAGSWADENAMHESFSTALQFPEYYGRNLDALNDCLGDVAELDYGWAENDTGLVIVIDNFDNFHSAMPEAAVTLLDIITCAALRGALLGNRVLCLTRSDDPWLEVGVIGGYSPQWNPREWRNADRLDQ